MGDLKGSKNLEEYPQVLATLTYKVL